MARFAARAWCSGILRYVGATPIRMALHPRSGCCRMWSTRASHKESRKEVYALMPQATRAVIEIIHRDGRGVLRVRSARWAADASIFTYSTGYISAR